MDIDKLKAALKAEKQPPFRFKQVLRAVFRDGAGSYDAVTVLPEPLRKTLSRKAPLLSLEPRRVQVSRDRGAHKALFSIKGGGRIESVLLKPKPGADWSACISSQAGCAMGCKFCATGGMGLLRNLSAEEITDQVLFWRQYLRGKKLKGRVANIVYMGMGEPLHNLEAVFESLRALMDPERFGYAARSLSVSTVGIIPGMERLAAEFPQVNLAVSLHTADDELRSRLVPVNRAYPLRELSAALGRILQLTRRKIFLEYVVLGRINDGLGAARDLARFVRSIGRLDLLHVNLIAWNPARGRYKPPPPWAVQKFRELLVKKGLKVTIRKSLGEDISAACGQLASKKIHKKR